MLQVLKRTVAYTILLSDLRRGINILAYVEYRFVYVCADVHLDAICV